MTSVEHLQESLIIHLKQLNITMTKNARINFVNSLLEKQNHKCVFGKNVGHIYCSNNLEWGYMKPTSRKDELIDNLYLLCSRCKGEIYM